MLVLTRHELESVVFHCPCGRDHQVKVVQIEPNRGRACRVRLGLTADRDVRITRPEVAFPESEPEKS